MLHTQPEYATVEAFVQFCLDDEKTTFTSGDAQRIAQNLWPTTPTDRTINTVIEQLKGWGLRLVNGERRANSRGFTANSHNRWTNGENAGGSGFEQINGFAGREG